MPDTLSLSAGVSLGLIAGIVSGVCYLFANGITWPKPEHDRRRCLPSPDDGLCFKCGGDTRGGLVPCICRPQPLKFESGAWLLNRVHRALTLMPWSLNTDKLEQIDEEYEGRESPGPAHTELRNIRDFLETLSAKLAGGPLEGTRVAPLYDHPAYDPPEGVINRRRAVSVTDFDAHMFERYHAALRGTLAALSTALRDALTHLPASRRGSHSSASTAHPSSGASGAHVQLKRLVARVVEEAAALPALARYAAEPPRSPTIESSTYEDLLATAILNKVIERYQTENGSGGRSSGIHSASASPTPSERSSPRSLNSRHLRDVTPPLHEVEVSDWEEGEGNEDVAELPRRVPFPEFGGDIVNQATENADRDFDEVSGSDIQAVDGSWEENWLFQKKKIKTIQSVPVPMLVPNSNTEYRVLIGDRDADDTTDLSDNASDAEEDAEYKSDIKRVLDSKHVIGGKTKIDEEMDFEPDSLTIIDGTDDFEKSNDFEYKTKEVLDAVNNDINDNKLNHANKNNDEGKDSIMILDIDSGPLPKAEFNLKEEIHRTLLNGNRDFINMDEMDSLTNEESKDVVDGFTNAKGLTNTITSRHEKEGEYEETVARPVQRYADSLRRQHFHDEPQEIPTRDTDNEENLIPGSIAYRERKKWLNYVDMPNNPYSPEAIQKRLMAKSTSSLFDMITNKTKDLNDDETDSKTSVEHDTPVKELKENAHTLNVNGDANNVNGTRSKSPSPKILKDVLAEEIPQYKRYDRDYYIREAKSSAGGRKKNNFSDTSSLSSMNKSISLDNFDTDLSPGLLIKQFNTIAANQEYTKFAKDQPKESITITTSSNKTEILIEYDDETHEQTLFSAKPVYLDDETDQRLEEILHEAYGTPLETKTNEEPLKSPTNVSVDNSYISTSSLEDSIKIYNVQTGEIVKCQPEDKIARFEETDRHDIDIVDKKSEETTEFSVSENLDDESVTIIEKSQENNLTDEEINKEFVRTSEVEEILAQLPKVKELAKKFVSMENLNDQAKPPQLVYKRRKSKDNILNSEKLNKIHMHSLTARSISKQFREELKLSMATPLTVPGGSKEIPEGEEVLKESSRPGSPLPEPGTIKTKLAFFESLKSKFSTK